MKVQRLVEAIDRPRTTLCDASASNVVVGQRGLAIDGVKITAFQRLGGRIEVTLSAGDVSQLLVALRASYPKYQERSLAAQTRSGGTANGPAIVKTRGDHTGNLT